MRRLTIVLAAVALAMALLMAPVAAGNNDWGEVTPHGHVMLVNAEFNAQGQVEFHRCVEFAAGKALRGPAHHNSVHIGAAGGSPFAQGALYNAGNLVIPLAPFVPFDWTGCESFTSPWTPPGG